jgi:sporulation protein YlmC with PRC-barrel domain
MIMSPHSISIVPKRDAAAALAPGLLAHFSDLDDDYMVADPVPDFRDWQVVLPDGRRVGTADDLVIDTSTMKVKYVEVKVDPEVVLGEDDRWVLVPIESVRIDEDYARVIVDQLPIREPTDATRRRGQLPTAEEERVILAYFGIVPAGATNG